MSHLLDSVVAGHHDGFALLHRPETNGDEIEVLAGTPHTYRDLADLPLHSGQGSPQELVVCVPYRQVRERGFAHHDDGSPLRAITVADRATVPVDRVLGALPEPVAPLTGQHFDTDDEAYAAIVARVIRDEIGRGEGANFVIRRSLLGAVAGRSQTTGLAVFRRLLQLEASSYWTFVVHCGGLTLVGASPERHLSVERGLAVMNPISGTYRYPPGGATLAGVTAFLADTKESDELYMVVDEELKMMARVCPDGVRVRGPYLREMANLAHTEYYVEGRTALDPRDLLRETLVAPTVTGSPLRSATSTIHRQETGGRSYYSGIVALLGAEPDGTQRMDSAITIRTAEIDDGGHVRIGVGATLVRHSDPASEVLETRAKAATLLRAFQPADPHRFGDHRDVQAALAARNDGISRFWFHGSEPADDPATDLVGCHALVVDAEDSFTAMIAQQLTGLGMDVTTVGHDGVPDHRDHELVVLGPGPGDPTDTRIPRMRTLRRLVAELLRTGTPLLGICLSHQIVADVLGIRLARRPVPNQGTQQTVRIFGAVERVAFYNTFAAWSPHDKVEIDGFGVVEVARDGDTGEVHALRGPGLSTMQFHPESLLTVDGPRLLARSTRQALGWKR